MLSVCSLLCARLLVWLLEEISPGDQPPTCAAGGAPTANRPKRRASRGRPRGRRAGGREEGTAASTRCRLYDTKRKPAAVASEGKSGDCLNGLVVSTSMGCRAVDRLQATERSHWNRIESIQPSTRSVASPRHVVTDDGGEGAPTGVREVAWPPRRLARAAAERSSSSARLWVLTRVVTNLRTQHPPMAVALLLGISPTPSTCSSTREASPAASHLASSRGQYNASWRTSNVARTSPEAMRRFGPSRNASPLDTASRDRCCVQLLESHEPDGARRSVSRFQSRARFCEQRRHTQSVC
jgi:hypothetical protein